MRMRFQRLTRVSLASLFAFATSMLPKPAITQGAGVTSLAAMRGRSRPLLVFAPKPNDAQLGIQLHILDEHAAEAHDRQLIPVVLPYHAPATTKVQFPDAEADALRRRFHIAPVDFVVILIGKDGGPKLRSTRPLSIAKLKEIIDAMPMRQEEETHAPGPDR